MSLLFISTMAVLLISAAGVIQAIVSSILLYVHPKSDRSVNIFLSLHILTISTFILMWVMQDLFFWQAFIPLIPLQFLIGPSLYLYIQSFKGTVTFRRAWPHFILCPVSAVVLYYSYSTWAYKFPLGEKVPSELLIDPRSYLHVFTRNAQMLVYFFLSLRALRTYQRSIRHLFSETSRISLSWVRWLINGYLFVTLLVIVLVFLVYKYVDYFNVFVMINAAVFASYIYLTTLKGMTQPTLWQVQEGANKEKVELEMIEAEQIDTGGKNEDTQTVKGLSDVKLNEVMQRTISLMEKDLLYQEPELTLQDLSGKLGIPSYQVSKVINEGLKTTFYDLVNGYRVKEAKRLLLDPKNRNYTILSVGFEAGFNSKTTFNTVFKKFTALTPTEYRQKNGEMVPG